MKDTKSRYNFLSVIAITVGLLFLALPAMAQEVLMALEGPIENVTDNNDGSGSVTVMGIVVDIPDGTPINSPTAPLTITQFADPTPLPGRTQPGFLGGTAIITGVTDGVTHTADDVFTEPAENVAIGVITDANCAIPGPTDNPDQVRFRLCNNNSIEILGAPTRRLTNGNTNSRMPADHPTNESGFMINLGWTHEAGELVGSSVGSEGYYDGSRLNWFAFELAGVGQLRNFDSSEASVLRAQCRERDDGIELDVMGAVHRAGTRDPQIFPDPSVGANGTTPTLVRIRVPAGGPVFGTTEVIPQLDEGTGAPNGFGDYDFQLSGNASFTTCPTEIRAIYMIQGEQNAAVNAEVAVR